MKRAILHLCWLLRERYQPGMFMPTVCRVLMVACIIGCFWNPWQIFTAFILWVLARMWEPYEE